EHGQVSRAGRFVLGAVDEDAGVPPGGGPLVHPRGRTPDRVVDRRQRTGSGVGIEQPDPADHLHVVPEGAVDPRDLQLARARGEAVAVPAVDRLLGGPERRERLAALVDVVELDAHHRAEDPAPSVSWQDADDGDSGGTQCGAARHGHPEAEGARAADDSAVVVRREHALELEVPQPPLGPVLGWGLAPEVVDYRVGGLAELLARPHLPDFGPPIFSRGAYSSIRRRSAPPSAKRTMPPPPGSTRSTTPSPRVPCRTESPAASDGTSSRGWTSRAPEPPPDAGRSRSRTPPASGSSSRKRDGRLKVRLPQSERDVAWVSTRRSCARVMPT